MDRDAIIREIESVLRNLRDAEERCSQRLLNTKEASQVIGDTKRKLEEILPHNSDAFRIYDRSKREFTDYWKVTLSGYVDPRDCKNISRWVNIVQDVINLYQPEFLGGEQGKKEQYFILAGDVYRAKKLLLKIMKRAKKSLAVVDPYLDEEIYDYIDSLNVSVSIQLITAHVKPIFQKLYNALKKTRLNIEAKEYYRSHDRFLIVDGSEFWHLGSSVNKFGEKDSMINRIVDAEESGKLFSAFNDAWTNGKIL